MDDRGIADEAEMMASIMGDGTPLSLFVSVCTWLCLCLCLCVSDNMCVRLPFLFFGCV